MPVSSTSTSSRSKSHILTSYKVFLPFPDSLYLLRFLTEEPSCKHEIDAKICSRAKDTDS